MRVFYVDSEGNVRPSLPPRKGDQPKDFTASSLPVDRPFDDPMTFAGIALAVALSLVLSSAGRLANEPKLNMPNLPEVPFKIDEKQLLQTTTRATVEP